MSDAGPDAGGRPFRPDHQHLPIPIGGKRPSHRHSSRRHVLVRHSSAIVAVFALAVAAAAVVTAATHADSTMYRDAAGIHVDGDVLTAEPGPQPGAWFGGDATMLLRSAPGGVEDAFAAGTLDGGTVTGRCAMQATAERCVFTVNGTSVTAQDTFTGDHWNRTYSNGRSAVVDVPAGRTLVPVALPLGLS